MADSDKLTKYPPFTKVDTSVVKGVAILALSLHHLYPNSPGIPMDFGNLSVPTLIATSCKACVAVFAILSGYGLTEGWKRRTTSEPRFVLRHVWTLLSSFWACYLVVATTYFLSGATLQSVYGVGGVGPVGNLLFDILGMAELFRMPTLSGPWWYMSAAIIFYLLFPLLYRGVKHTGLFFLCICFIPWVAYMAIGDTGMHTDWFLFYIFSFSVGIYLSERDLLAIAEMMSQERPALAGICSLALILLTLAIRAIVTLPADPLLGLSLIFLEICVLSKTRVLKAVLKKFGDFAGVEYMTEGIIPLLVSRAVFPSFIGCYLIFVLLSLCISIGISQLLKAIGFGRISRPWKYAGQGTVNALSS